MFSAGRSRYLIDPARAHTLAGDDPACSTPSTRQTTYAGRPRFAAVIPELGLLPACAVFFYRRGVHGPNDLERIKQDLLDAADFAFRRLRDRLDGLTDQEYFWEPADGCWSVRLI